MYLKLLFKIIQAASEAIAVTFIYFEKHKNEPKMIAKIAVIIRKIIYVILFLKVPFEIIFKKTDEQEKAIRTAFVNLSLLESLSYCEWRDFEQIWDKIKDDERLHDCFREKGKEELNANKLKQIVLTLTLTLAQLGLFEIRTENKEEFVKDRTKLKNVHGDESKSLDPKNISGAYKEKLEEEYSALENLPGYERFANGIRILFLRKPIGTKKDTKEEEKTLSLIPGFG